MTIPEELVRDFDHLGYRDYGIFDHAELSALVRLDFAKAKLWSLGNEAESFAVLGYQPLPWDSEILGRRYAKLTPMMVNEACPSQQRERLLDHVIEDCLGQGFEVINWELEQGQEKALQACCEAGFQLLDTKLTYLITRFDPFMRLHRKIYQIRDFVSEDRDQLITIGQMMFEHMGGRFFADPSLGAEQAQQVYLHWLRGALQPGSGYRIRVAQQEGAAVGFLCYRICSEVQELTGKTIFGKGLGAVSPQASGAYLDLLSESISLDYELADAAEFETPKSNLKAAAVFERLGLRLVRSRYQLKLDSKTWRSGSVFR